MILDEFIQKIKKQPERLEFQEVLDVIAQHYRYIPTHFINGVGEHLQDNPAGTNEGSCKIFAFGKICNLTKEQVLACFGRYYREDVLLEPEGTNHGNIRAFIKSGWEGLSFSTPPLEKIN